MYNYGIIFTFANKINSKIHNDFNNRMKNIIKKIIKAVTPYGFLWIYRNRNQIKTNHLFSRNIARREPVNNSCIEGEGRKCIEIGPGTERIPGFLTVNAVKSPITDYVVDLSKENLPFNDETIDVVFTSHFLEHIEWFNVQHCLDEMYRVLRKGGYVDVFVPDGHKEAQVILDAEAGKLVTTPDGWNRLNPDDNPYIWANGRIFYGANQSYPSWHKGLFTYGYLKWLFEKANFTDIQRLDDSQTLGVKHGWINLGIRGYKSCRN